MTRAEILTQIKEYKDENAKKYGIISLGVFGSIARNESSKKNDVDIVVTIQQPNLFTLSRIRIELEEVIHTHVDLINYRNKMNSFLKKRIDKEAVYV